MAESAEMRDDLGLLDCSEKEDLEWDWTSPAKLVIEAVGQEMRFGRLSLQLKLWW